MSFKDDFFEALRSVKRDFLREPDPISSAGGPADQSPPRTGAPASGAENEAAKASHEPSHAPKPPEQEPAASRESKDTIRSLEDTGEFRMPDNIITADDDAPSQSDEEVFSAFQQASAIDDSDEDDSSDGDDEDAGVHTPIGDHSDTPPPYRSYEPGLPNIAEYPPSGDGRKIFDFEPDDFYSDDKTIISRNTIIRGALQTEDSVRMLGQVMGDIDCKSNIVVAGKIRGNTSAANAYIVDAQIDGNMVCDDAVNVNKDAWILGNVRAQQAEIDGKVKGNIEIRHAVSIGSTSSVIGNISTDELEIKRGAFVNGQIIMYSPSRDVIDRFDDFDRN